MLSGEIWVSVVCSGAGGCLFVCLTVFCVQVRFVSQHVVCVLLFRM